MSSPPPLSKASGVAAAGGSRPALVRAIGRWDLTAAFVNVVIGSAIFGAPATLASLTGAWSPLAALLAGLGFLAITLCFAEVASRFKEPGGPYLYAHEAFGPLAGFEVGWLTFWTRVLSAAANLNVLVLYLAEILPLAGTPGGRAVAMTLLVFLVTVANVVGVRQATWIVNGMTVAKVLPLAFLIVLGLPQVERAVLQTQVVATPDWTQAILLLVFAYGGFEAALIPAGEVKDPRRDTGFALLTALGIVAAVYMLVQLVVVGVVPHAAGAKAPIAAAFGEIVGPVGVLLASLAAVLSISGWTMGNILASPRVLFSMADRGVLPRALARVHERYRTPHVAIVVYALLALAVGLGGTFAGNAMLAAIVRLVYYGLTCAALFVFRRRRAEAPGFLLPAAGVVVPIAIAFCVWLLSTRTFTQAWVLGALIVAGLPFYWLRERRAAPADPAPQADPSTPQ